MRTCLKAGFFGFAAVLWFLFLHEVFPQGKFACKDGGKYQKSKENDLLIPCLVVLRDPVDGTASKGETKAQGEIYGYRQQEIAHGDRGQRYLAHAPQGERRGSAFPKTTMAFHEKERCICTFV